MIDKPDRPFSAAEAIVTGLPVLSIALSFTLLFATWLSVEVRGPLLVATFLSGFVICSAYAHQTKSSRCIAPAVGIVSLVGGNVVNGFVSAVLVPLLGQSLPPPLAWPFVQPPAERAAAAGLLTVGLLIAPAALLAARAGFTATILAVLGGVSPFASVGWTESRPGALGLLGAIGPFMLVVFVALTPARWRAAAAWCALAVEWMLVLTNRWLAWGLEGPAGQSVAHAPSLAESWVIIPNTLLIFSVTLLALAQVTIGWRRARAKLVVCT